MKYDVIVIGSGPAGYVAAIRAGQSGLKTLVVDQKYIGGMCLNWGCIPTKSILESAKLYRKIQSASSYGIKGIESDSISLDWGVVKQRTESIVKKLSKGIEYLWKKNGVEFLAGKARIVSEHNVEVGNQIFEARYILLATGSKPASIKSFEDSMVISMEDFLAMEELPQNPLIYGSGSIVVEIAQFFSMLGKQPIVLLDRYPILPINNGYLNTQLEKILKKEKIPFLKNSDVEINNDSLNFSGTKYSFDKVINCSMRKGVIIDSEIPIAIEDNFIKVNEFFQTNYPEIYAIGDVNGLSFLAHVASAQAMATIDHINGKVQQPDLSIYPLNIYTEPEIASIGKSEEILKDENIEYKVSEYFFSANGKAQIEGKNEGSVRILYESRYQQVLGVQIVGSDATDMIGEASILMELEGTIYDVAKAIHAHPTISEVFMDAGIPE